MRENWDDLRFVLAVAEEGSVSAAARRLGVNHATVLRRIAACEATLGQPIFERSGQGYTLPEAQRPILEATREVERAIQAVRRVVQGLTSPLSGEVRVTATDSFCQCVLAPMIGKLHAAEPGIRLVLLSSNAHLDLGRIHAEIAVRPALRLPEDLAGEIAARLGFGLFRARGCAVTGWLGLSGSLQNSVAGRWQESEVPAGEITMKADSFLVLRELCAAGQGLALMPLFLGAADARLERVLPGPPPLEAPVWVACHADMAAVPRIARVRELLVRALGEIGPLLQHGSG